MLKIKLYHDVPNTESNAFTNTDIDGQLSVEANVI